MVDLKDALKKYKNHCGRAKYRRIKMELTFEEWLDIWVSSGHWHERGSKTGQYVMSRVGDKGNYAIGNVFIQLATQNSSDAQLIHGKFVSETGTGYTPKATRPGLGRPCIGDKAQTTAERARRSRAKRKAEKAMQSETLL
jgi:hypothetical protein